MDIITVTLLDLVVTFDVPPHCALRAHTHVGRSTRTLLLVLHFPLARLFSDLGLFSLVWFCVRIRGLLIITGGLLVFHYIYYCYFLLYAIVYTVAHLLFVVNGEFFVILLVYIDTLRL